MKNCLSKQIKSSSYHLGESIARSVIRQSNCANSAMQDAVDRVDETRLSSSNWPMKKNPDLLAFSRRLVVFYKQQSALVVSAQGKKY